MEEKSGGVSSLFSFLPEGCISNIISWTSPKDACRASTISMGFKSASESDTVWEQFFPLDYKEIISKSVSPPLNFSTKKELYFYLCHSPNLINDGKLSFWLSVSSGKKCYMLCARELSIAWKDTPRYWSWTAIPESRFSEVAELLEVWWLDIRGKIQTQLLSLKTTYAAYLVFKTTEMSKGLEYVAMASVGFAGGSNISTSTSTSSSSTSTTNPVEPKSIPVYLKPPTYIHITPDVRRAWQRPRPRPVQKIDGMVPHERNDGWMEIFLGEFYNDEGDGDIKMQLSETTFLNWKRGLILEGIELRPKEDA